ncbi:MAG: histidinol-phosphate transaminase [Pseudomonadales bacterium]
MTATANDPLGQLIEQWIKPEIRSMTAYHVANAEGMIKLDAMENPYDWDESIVESWIETLRNVHLNRYPDPSADKVKQCLREVMRIPAGQDIVLGNGSDELIQLLAMAVSAPGKTLLTVEPGFAMYRQIAQVTELSFQSVALTADFDLDMPELLAQIEQQQPALIFLAQPNNPTGNLFGEDKVRQVIEAAPGLVVIDEAYTPFTDADYLPLLEEYNNVLVMRTLSKAGLAGLRLGLLVGHPRWIAELEKIRLPYNIGVLTQASAEFALQHYDVLRQQTAMIREERTILYAGLTAIDGLTVWKSEANFILFRTQPGKARAVFDALREHRILIRCLDGAHPLLADCLRVTVGSAAENQAFLTELNDIL